MSGRTAFVLAGGGSLGAVQVGMLKALTKKGIVPDLLVGASVGALNAACFAYLPSSEGLERLERIWLGLQSASVFPLSPVNSLLAILGKRNHLISPARLQALIASELPYERIEDARIPLHVVATDVLEGTEVCLSRGLLAPALLASAAIPAIFPSVSIQDRHLIDGGVANNTPISCAMKLGASRIIVLATGISCALEKPPRGAVALALHAVNLLVMRQLVSDIEHFSARVELIVLPPLCPVTVSSYDFSQTAELVHRAEARTRQWLQRNGLQSRGAPDELLAHHHEHGIH
ncbi:MAG: patatin-like phospholipase family protein [Steroidobacteraceae bacterium]